MLDPISNGRMQGAGWAAPARAGAAPAPVSGPSFAQQIDAARLESLEVPPPEVHDALDRAARVIGGLERQGMRLRFGVDEATGRVRVDAVGRDGAPIREIPATSVLDALETGAPGALLAELR